MYDTITTERNFREFSEGISGFNEEIFIYLLESCGFFYNIQIPVSSLRQVLIFYDCYL